MEDRFGPPPPAALTFVRAMGLRTVLRALHVLGCEANRERVTLHLREDTPLDPAKVMAKVGLPRSPWRNSDGSQSAAALDGSVVFDALGCASC
jgi:transcription-repair coupling factor (superfamily II helicase)